MTLDNLDRVSGKYFSYFYTKQEDHDGPIWLTWANSFAYLTTEVSAKFIVHFIIALLPSGHVFFKHHDGLNWILKEGHQRNKSAKLYWNQSSGFWQNDF